MKQKFSSLMREHYLLLSANPGSNSSTKQPQLPSSLSHPTSPQRQSINQTNLTTPSSALPPSPRNRPFSPTHITLPSVHTPSITATTKSNSLLYTQYLSQRHKSLSRFYHLTSPATRRLPNPQTTPPLFSTPGTFHHATTNPPTYPPQHATQRSRTRLARALHPHCLTLVYLST